MGVWNRLAFTGKTVGIFEAGSRVGKTLDQIASQNPGASYLRKWNFKTKSERRFGRGFRAALNRMGESSYKKKILGLIQSKKSKGFLSEKQWKYLGLLMRKADPACLDNPKMKAPSTPRTKTVLERYSGLRKKAQTSKAILVKS